MRPVRTGMLVGGIHLTLSFIGGIIALGAAFGAQRPWANTVGEQIVVALTFVLLVPLSLLNLVLPRDMAPGYPVAGVLLTSVVWGVVAWAIARWRQGRAARPRPPLT